MVRSRRNQSTVGRENKSPSENKKNNSSNNQSGKRFAKREFKFYAADSGVKNPYTFEKIEEAIILKVQTTFEGVTVPDVVRSLRTRKVHVYDEPELVVSEETDPAKFRAEERRNGVRYDKQYDRWESNVAEFNSLWVKAYSLIWDS